MVLREGHHMGYRFETLKLNLIESAAPLDLQLRHSRAECAGIETKNSCGTVRTFDSPTRVFECADDVIALDLLKALW